MVRGGGGRGRPTFRPVAELAAFMDATEAAHQATASTPRCSCGTPACPTLAALEGRTNP